MQLYLCLNISYGCTYAGTRRCSVTFSHLLLSLCLGSLLSQSLGPLPTGGPHSRAGCPWQSGQRVVDAPKSIQATHAAHALGTQPHARLLQQLLRGIVQRRSRCAIDGMHPDVAPKAHLHMHSVGSSALLLPANSL